MDLKAFVPAILFKDNEKGSQAKEKEDAKGTSVTTHMQTHKGRDVCFVLTALLSGSDGREGKDAGSTTEELELELEALDIADEPLELEGPDEVENEELAKKLLDEQGKHKLHLGSCYCYIYDKFMS